MRKATCKEIESKERDKLLIFWNDNKEMNSLQQIKDRLVEGNIMKEEKIFMFEDCKCKSLFRTRGGFKCFDCGKEFEDGFGYKEREL